MKKLLLIISILTCYIAQGQYNNEWIDYNKTYYKFPVGKNALNRITQPVLQSIGLANTPAEQLQLWRNGIQVPVYTSVASGLLGPSDYVEFWGEMNDGKADAGLYPDINFQLSDKWSLETDTASYFLTVNPVGNNLRITNQVNNVAANVLPAEQYFMHTAGRYFRDKINSGWAQIVTEYVYSSVYDRGEGYTSSDIYPGGPLAQTMSNLYPYTSGPNATFTLTAAGNAANNRNIVARVNGSTLVNVAMDAFYDQRQQVTFPVSSLNSGSANVEISNTSSNPNDRMVVAKYEITYPRQFNFGDTTNFVFELAANTNGNYLRITFNYGSPAPVLYDLTNYKRYIGVIDEPGIVKFALLPSGQKRKLVLVSQAESNIVMTTGLQTRNFIDYSQPDRQGNYLIISNPLLYTGGTGGNAVEAYRLYRSSTSGGGYNSKIYDIDQLTDQFAFGIKRHPFAIKKFLKYARTVFSATPAYVFLIGKGVSYVQAKSYESNPLLDRLNLIPPYGYPASDNLFASNEHETIGLISIGRLSVVNAAEIDIYLTKVKEFESVGLNTPQTIEGRSWMKNIVHAIGGGSANLSREIGGYMNNLKQIIEDTLYGGYVESFSKTSAVATQLTSEQLEKLFAEGIGIVNYFGHSSATTTEFNIDDPYIYQNQGKYPLFLVNGCLAGDIFNFEPGRFSTLSTLSEKYLLANQRGAIAFVASTHFGIVSYLNIYLNGLYKAMSGKKYGESLGEAIEESFRYLLNSTPGDYLGRLHAEEITLNGDPAIKLYTQDLPDYAVNDQNVVLPALISVSDNNFKVSIKLFNIGKAIADSFYLDIKLQNADGSVQTLVHNRIRGIASTHTIELNLPINPAIQKGENKLLINMDPDNEISEVSKSNNSLTKVFYIVDDGARPVYPYNFSIVNTNTIKFVASTSNPLVAMQEYVMEIDTTELFNSSLKKDVSVNASGGVMEFNPGVTFTDSTVYYWRVARKAEDMIWNNASFVYINDTISGYNQSHYFQFQKDIFNDINLENDRTFTFAPAQKTLKIATGLYPYYAGDPLRVTINEDIIDVYGCSYNSLQFVVYDGVSFIPWKNSRQGDGFGRFGSVQPCGHNNHTFEFNYTDANYRRKAVEFLESLPDGSYISITNLGTTSNTSFISNWMSDTATLGSNRSLYHILKQYGLNAIDSFTRNLPLIFLFKKGDPSFSITTILGESQSQFLTHSFDITGSKTEGDIRSTWFGPGLEWNKLVWKGTNKEVQSDLVSIDIYGRDNSGNENFIKNIKTSLDTSLAFIDSKQYPYLQLKLNNKDSIYGTPHQLQYWRLFSKLPPEGAVVPGVFYNAGKDTLYEGETFKFGVAFQNISNINFDSLKVKLIVLDKNNVQHVIYSIRAKPLMPGDTIRAEFSVDTKDYPGLNTLMVSFNADNDQPEQYYLNNFLYKTFFVRSDDVNPLLDVTVDGVHILNNDIISSKPHILIKLEDENRFVALDDTVLIKVQVKYPNGSLRTFSFNSDTLRFTPASLSSNNTDNTATIDFNPQFLEDGDYQLIVSGRDKSGNTAGQSQYTVAFKIINKPMISNMFNYPNPFTTSTAFVFTLTGAEIPQNLRIQIMTITGKIVKEITKTELGPIRIGRNITEYKWDGTDQYGQKLANGIYLYRVITNLNGKSLDKYKTDGDQTDQYFNKGYGKMYLMR